MSYIIAHEVELGGRLALFGVTSSNYDVSTISRTDSGSVSLDCITNANIIGLQTAVTVYRARMIEEELRAVKKVVENRKDSMEALQLLLGDVMKAEAGLESLTDKGPLSWSVINGVNNYVRPYISMSGYDSSGDYTKGNMQILEQYIQSVLDLLDNDLSQDMMRLSQIDKKRNSAFDLISKLIKKFTKASKNNIGIVAQ